MRTTRASSVEQLGDHVAVDTINDKLLTVDELKSLRGREFLEKSVEHFRKSLEESSLRVGVNLGDYSLANLRAIDEDLSGSVEEACAKEGIPPEPGVLWSMYHGYGSYLGTVIVRNLGGEWRTPSTLRLWLSNALRRPQILFDHWYVVVQGRRIPVFKVARWRCDGSGRVKSLAEVYDRIASGNSWSE